MEKRREILGSLTERESLAEGVPQRGGPEGGPAEGGPGGRGVWRGRSVVPAFWCFSKLGSHPFSLRSVMGLSARSSFSWSLREKKSGRPEAAPRRAKHFSCRTCHPVGAVLALYRVQLEGSVAQSFFLEARKEGLCGLVGAADDPSNGIVLLRWPHRGQGRGGLGLGVVPSLARDLLGTEWDETVARAAQVTVPAQTERNSSDLAKKTRPVDLVESVLQIHCEEAPFFIVAVFLEPPFDGFTAVCGPELQLRWEEVSCHVLGNGSQRGFRCEKTKSLSCGHRWPPSSFSNTVEMALAIQETVRPSMLLTTARKARTSSFRSCARRTPLLCCGQRPDGPVDRVRRKGKEGLLGQGERSGRGEGDWGNGQELPSGHLLCSRLRVAVWHLLGRLT